jgi:predicted RND superfamily exporter protein
MARFTNKILFLLVCLSIIGLGLKLAKNRLPFKLSEILVKNHPVRIAYENYDKLYGNEQSIFILAEYSGQEKPAINEVIALLKRVHWSTGKSRAVDDTVSLLNAEYFTVKHNYISMRTFIKDSKLITQQAQKQLNSTFWEKTLLSQDKKHLLISVTFKKKIIGSKNERIHFANFIKSINEIQNDHKKWKMHLLGVKLAEYHLIKDAIKIQKTITPILLLLLGLLIVFLFKRWAILFYFYLSMMLAYSVTIIFINFHAGGISAYTGFSIFFVLIISTSDLIHYFSVYKEIDSPDINIKMRKTRERLLVPCFLTSLTTTISFASLMVSDVLPIGDLGFYSAAGSIIAFIITFTVLPLGIKIFNFSYPKLQPMPSFKLGTALNFTLNFPKTIISIFSIFGIICIILSSKLIVNDTFYDQFISTHPISKSIKAFSEHFQFLDTIELEVKFQSKQPDFRTSHQQMVEFEKDLEGIKGISHIKSHARFYNYLADKIENNPSPPKEFTKAQHLSSIYKMALDYDVLDDFFKQKEQVYRTVIYLKDSSSLTTSRVSKEIQKAHDELESSQFTIGFMGNASLRNYLNNTLVDNILRSLLMSLGLIFITLLVIFRNFKVALIGLVPNIVPLLFIGGLMGFLGVPLETNVVLLVCVTIGVAVDDTIHFLYPLYLNMKSGKYNTEESIRITFEGTSKALLGTTFVLVLSFPCFFFADLKIYTQTGVFVMLSLLLALIADLLLLPAIIKLCIKDPN